MGIFYHQLLQRYIYIRTHSAERSHIKIKGTKFKILTHQSPSLIPQINSLRHHLSSNHLIAMHTTVVNYRYKRSASRLTVGAHLFGILAIILMLVWLLHYRGGIDYDSDNSDRVFNVHPFLMFFGFIFFAGEAMMAYKTVMSEHQGQKYMHALLHLIALCTGIFGICAAFRYHDMRQIDDMYTLHSWIGLGTFILYGLQWLVGAAAFLFPGGTAESRLRLIPWHMSMGRTILYLSICAALTGLMQKFTFLGLSKALGDRESHLINFTALAILLFGIFVDLSVALARYV